MKIQITILAALMLALADKPCYADGVPEPGLILYGKVRNAAAGNALG